MTPLEFLESRTLFSTMWITGPTHNTSGIEWSSDRTLTIVGTHRSEALEAVAFSGDQMGQVIADNTQPVTRAAMGYQSSTINLIRNLDGEPGAFAQLQFTSDTDATGYQLSLAQYGAEDGVLIIAARRGVVERWIVRRSLVDRVVIDAGAGNDTLFSGAAFDATGKFQFDIPSTLLGGAGKDQIVSQGNSLLAGGAGEDALVAIDADRVTLLGGRGDDYLDVTDPADSIDGGGGFDRINYTAGAFKTVSVEKVNPA